MAHQHMNSVLFSLMQYRIHVYVSQTLFPIVCTYACWTFYTIPILHSASHIDRWLGTNLDSLGADLEQKYFHSKDTRKAC